MDFKDYINELSNLDNQEARTELSTFYTLNASIFKYFKVVDETILGLLRLPNISVKTLQMIAKASVNKNILKKITEFTTDYWDTICYSEDVDEVKDKYERYSLVKILKLNTNLSANLRQLLEDCSLDIESELG